MRWIVFVLALVVATPSILKANTSCSGTQEIDPPFPLGARAPIPWNEIDGYWTDYVGTKYFYRIEVQDVFEDESRSIRVEVMDGESMSQIVGSGLGFVRANSWDLWARVKGLNFDAKIRILAFFPKGSSDLNRRVLIASFKDMRDNAPKCLKRYVIRKVDVLESSAKKKRTDK